MNLSIQTVINTILTRVDTANVNNSRANKGAVFIKGNTNYSTDMHKYVFVAIHHLTARFISDTIECPLGHAKLTEVSASIGRNIAQEITEEHVPTHIQLSIGDLMLSGFENNGFIEIFQNPGFATESKDAPYMITPTPKYEDLGDIPNKLLPDMIKGTLGTKIPDISRMVQSNCRPVIKGYTDEHLKDLSLAIKVNAPWIQSINNLQKQKWMINKEVLEVIVENFDSMLKPVPPRPYVGCPDKVKKAFKALKDKDTKVNRDKYNKAVDEWNVELSCLSATSKNAERKKILRKAQELAENPEYSDGFYQFVEVDYRGRVYYFEPFMNYQGSDMARGLMMFGEGKPLGQSGVRWLAIHTANSYNATYSINKIPKWCTYDYKTKLESQGLESISVDKMTLKDRELWTWENMKMILASADKLVDCEKSVSFLACCIEWTKVKKDGFDTISHLPVAIDGSCNGYQHSAAIAKDEITGGLVSLTHQEVQEDLYVEAAHELVKRMPAYFAARPEMKMKHIRKGIAKRAVMTRAYSAGKDIIAESMYKDCYAEGYTKDFNITMLDCVELADTLYDLIADVCPGATRTMKFLQDLATYELGNFKTFDKDGNTVSTAKKSKLHAAKQELKRIPSDEITEEQLAELQEVSALLESYETRLVFGNGKRTIDWWTPTGFHVIYESWKTKREQVKSTIPGWEAPHKKKARLISDLYGYPKKPTQLGRVSHILQTETDFPNLSAFQAGVSPNFIHSMDAAHMGAVIADWEGSFGAVHDSFSTHACDIEELSMKTREKFVDLYDVDDPYAAIAEIVLSPCVYDEELPELGSLDIEGVRNATYFFC